MPLLNTATKVYTGSAPAKAVFLGATKIWPPAAPPAGYAGRIKSLQPISYWRFGEQSGTTGADEMGRYGCTYTGSPTLGAPGLLTGDADTAMQVAGVINQGASAGNPQDYWLQALTLEAWIKTSGAGATYRGILVKQDGYGLFAVDNVLSVYEWASGQAISSGANIADGNRHHVVVVFQASGSQMYLDGAPVGSAFNHTTQSHAHPLTIGYATFSGQEFTGAIDEAAIYGRALTAVEVAGNWTAGTTTGWGPDESIFAPAAIPASNSPQSSPFTFGFRFTPTAAGRITAVRFWSNHAGSNRPVAIWSTGGVKLASGIGPAQEPATGWVTIPLSAPLAVAAGTTYLTAYGWHHTWSQLPYSADGVMSATANLTAGTGTYHLGDMDTFPASTDGLQYYADVVFQAQTGGGFKPTDIGGLFTWLDAAQITGVPDGGVVLSWPDASGQNHPAAKNTGDAVYRAAPINGKPAVRFGEYGGMVDLRIALDRALGDRTVFAVIKTMAPPFSSWHSVQVQELDPYMQTYGNPTIHTYTTPDLDSGRPFSGAGQLISLWCDSAAHTQGLEVDGVQVTAGYTPAATASTATIYVGGFTPAAYGMNGHIGELIVYERCLTFSERGNVLAYLRAKWGTP